MSTFKTLGLPEKRIEALARQGAAARVALRSLDRLARNPPGKLTEAAAALAERLRDDAAGQPGP